MADITETLEERGKRYGKFTGHARVSQEIQIAMANGLGRNGNSWDSMEYDQVEALFMIAHKIGRIINGDPDYADSWVDIAGYAQLVADRLNGEER